MAAGRVTRDMSDLRVPSIHLALDDRRGHVPSLPQIIWAGGGQQELRHLCRLTRRGGTNREARRLALRSSRAGVRVRGDGRAAVDLRINGAGGRGASAVGWSAGSRTALKGRAGGEQEKWRCRLRQAKL